MSVNEALAYLFGFISGSMFALLTMVLWKVAEAYARDKLRQQIEGEP